MGGKSRVYSGHVEGSKGNILGKGELVGTDQGTKIDEFVLRLFSLCEEISFDTSVIGQDSPLILPRSSAVIDGTIL